MGVTVGASALIGAFGGGLVPFAAYRLSVPAGDPPLAVCVSCGRPVPAGWVRMPARCGACGVRWGPYVWVTAMAGSVSCGLIGYALGSRPELPIYLALCLFGVLLGAIDVACKRLPHALVVPAIGVSGLLLAGVAAVTGDWAAWIRAILAAAALGGFYLLLFALPWRGLGLGDVKLALLLGAFLGWIGWRCVGWGVLLPWLLNGPIVVGLLLAGRIGRRTAVPFGPAMLVGALAAVVVGTSIDGHHG